MPENDGRHHDNSITVLKEQESQERGNGDADTQKREKEKEGEEKMKRSLQRMLGQMRPDEEEKKGRKIQEKPDGTGEYKTEIKSKQRRRGGTE